MDPWSWWSIPPCMGPWSWWSMPLYRSMIMTIHAPALIHDHGDSCTCPWVLDIMNMCYIYRPCLTSACTSILSTTFKLHNLYNNHVPGYIICLLEPWNKPNLHGCKRSTQLIQSLSQVCGTWWSLPCFVWPPAHATSGEMSSQKNVFNMYLMQSSYS